MSSTDEHDDLDEKLATLTSNFNAICSRANTQIASLPRHTRKTLSKQTGSIFTKYASHGSEARLAHDLHAFLTTPPDADLSFIPLPQPSSPRPRPIHTNDPDSSDLVTSLPFHHDLTLTINPTVLIPPHLLPSLSRMLALHSALASALLTHHTTHYGPHPIFRTGIRSYITSHLSTLLQSTTSHSLSLTPETRTFLRAVYERHGSELNDVENRLLAQACRVDEDAVDLFFEDLDVVRRDWWAMRKVIAAREIEMWREEKERMGEVREQMEE